MENQDMPIMKSCIVIPYHYDSIVKTGSRDKNGQPIQNDSLRVAQLHKNADDQYAPHPVMSKFDDGKTTKIDCIFNTQNCISSQYQAFDTNNNLVCKGDGNIAHRNQSGNATSTVCHGPGQCEFASVNHCKQIGRFYFALADTFNNNPLETTVFRTSSWNSIRQITSKVCRITSLMNGNIFGLEFKLVIKRKNTTSGNIFFVDIEFEDFINSIKKAKIVQKQYADLGVNIERMEHSIAKMLNNESFAPLHDEPIDIAEELMDENQKCEASLSITTGDTSCNQSQRTSVLSDGAHVDNESGEVIYLTRNKLDEIRSLLKSVGKSELALTKKLSQIFPDVMPRSSIESLPDEVLNYAINSLKKLLDLEKAA